VGRGLVTLHHGDCIEVMAGMEPESVDAIVTDPPYGLTADTAGWRAKSGESFTARPDLDLRGGGFMGKAWDGTGIAFRPETWEAAYRVAKPSAYLLAFGGTRTVHRMTCAIEDAGWIVRDMLVWAYASGFPKSRALLKPAWEPIVMARKPGPLRDLAIDACRIGVGGGGTDCPDFPNPCGGHEGHGRYSRTTHVSGPTAIMDAWESEPNLCVLCAVDADSPERLGTSATRGSTTPRRAGRRPSASGTPGDTNRAATGCFHGTTPENGASSLSIGESGRTPTGLFLPDTSSTISTRTSSTTGLTICTCCGGRITPTTTGETPFDTETGPRAPTTSESTEGGVGRWPSNVVLTDPVFDGGWDGVVGGGEATTGGNINGRPVTGYGKGWADERFFDGYGDSGTYSRFFLVPKAARSDREPVLGGLPEQEPRLHLPTNATKYTRQDGTPGINRARANVHPTVKPTELMRHLVRLVTPTGGVVLDPFLGSGTTALAAEMEGFAWVGIEREAEYVAIAEARLNGTQRGLGLEASS